jgi:hypothetical protein
LYGKREEMVPILNQKTGRDFRQSERRFIQGDRPEAGAELAMTVFLQSGTGTV